MKQKTKVINVAMLILILIMQILSPVISNAEEIIGKSDSRFKYEILKDGTIEISDYIGNDTEVIIPSSIDNYTVTRIGSSAFDGCSSLSSIEIPEGVTSIYPSAFYSCSSLRNITIPNSVTTIGYNAFDECTSLSNITIPNSVTSIGVEAFYGCTSLSDITIPKSVTSIGDSAFSGCSNLENIFVEEDNLKYSSKDGILFDKDKTILIKYPEKKNQTEYIIPNSVTSIGSEAFYGCSSLSSIEIPDTVRSIARYAFERCTSLSSITISSNVIDISYAFYGCTSLNSIIIPSNVIYMSGAFKGCSSLSSVVIPNTVRNIGNYAFEGCSSLSSVVIPDTVRSIGDSAFKGCSSLSSIVIPSGVTSIGWNAFSGCSRLSSIIIPYGVTSIQNGTFAECRNLTNITIPNSVTSIGRYSFSSCDSLSSIIIPSSVTNIEYGAFIWCSSLSSIVIPEGVTSIGDNAFEKMNLTIKCKSNTEGEEYAKKNSINYIIDDDIECEIQYSTKELTNENIVVTLKINERVQEIEGWNVLEDGTSITKTYEQNTNEDIQVMDLVGNTFNVNIDISNIDKAGPITSVKYNVTTQTNQYIIATITSNEPMQEVEGWILSADKLTLVKTYTQNIEEVICIKDLAGNISNTEISILNIDKTPPVVSVSYNETNITNQDVIATITSNEPIQEIEGWRLSLDKLSMYKTYTQNVKENIIEVTDMAGNSTTAKVSISNIDKIKPNINISYNTIELTNKEVIATITSNEPIQEVAGWTLSQDSLSITKTYTENITQDINVKDIAGNTTTIKVQITNIDKIAPQIEVKYDVKEENVEVIITSNEKVQAIEGWKLSEDEKVLTKTYKLDEIYTITIKDIVGNEQNIVINTTIDKKTPVATVKYSKQTITNENVIVTIEVNEQVQEVAGWNLSQDKKVLTKTYSTNGSESVTIKDLAGNEAQVQINVGNIDKVKPVATVKYSKETITNENVIVTIEVNEQVQQVEGWSLSENKKVLTKTYSANGSESVTIKDLAGNEVQVQIEVTIKEEISIDNAKIENEKVYGIKTKVTKEELTKRIQSNVSYKIKDAKGKELENTQLIGTGTIIELERGGSYTFVVTGDIDGDGKITANDLLKMKRQIVEVKGYELQGVYKEASDINEDSLINATDLLRIKRAIVGLLNL